MSSRISFVHLTKLDVESFDDDSIVLSLAFALNDIQVANGLLSMTKESQHKLKELKQPGGAYCVRLQCSHLYEARWIVRRISESGSLLGVLDKCDVQTREAFQRLEMFLKNKKHLRILRQVRNKVTFHYDEKDNFKHIRKAVELRRSGKGRALGEFVNGENIFGSRIRFADSLLDTILCRDILGVKGDDLVQESYKYLEPIDKACRDVIDFAPNFIRRYLSWRGLIY